MEYKIQTQMNEQDYKNFLTFHMFHKGKAIWIYTAILSIVAATACTYVTQIITIPFFLFCWALMIATILITLRIKIHLLIKKRLKTDRGNLIRSEVIFYFHEEDFVMENQGIASTATLSYDKIYQVVETKDFYALYLNVNQATLISKRNIENVDEFGAFLLERTREIYKDCRRKR